MSNHDIRVQAWAHDVVVACITCGEAGSAGLALARGTTHAGLTFGQVTAAVEAHTGEGAFRASSYGTQVEGQTTFGTETPAVSEPDLVAFGQDEDPGPGYHPRTGQALEPTGYSHADCDHPATKADRDVCRRIRRSDGGPSLREYLESKGEL